MRGRAQLPRTQLLGSGKRRGDPGAGLVEELKECDMITQSDKAGGDVRRFLIQHVKK